MKRLILILALAGVVAGCGIKGDLVKPNGHATPQNENDPSKPPQPLGR